MEIGYNLIVYINPILDIKYTNGDTVKQDIIIIKIPMYRVVNFITHINQYTGTIY